jgi:holo-[acyl-carrier protein] synthase
MVGIVSVGIDMVDVERIRASLREYPRFIERFAIPAELEGHGDLSGSVPHFSGLLAIKEAVIKVLVPDGSEGSLLRMIEVKGIPPKVTLHDKALALSEERGIANLFVSVSHEGNYAIAIALAAGASQ